MEPIYGQQAYGQMIEQGLATARVETKHEAASRMWAQAKDVLVNAHEERNRAETALQQALQAEEAAWNALADTAGRGPQPTLPTPNRLAR